MRPQRRWALLLLLAAAPAAGAVRAHLGGTLAVGLVGLVPPAADSQEEGPEAASARALLALPLCRLLPEAVPLLATFQRVGQGPAEEVQLLPKESARFGEGSPLRPSDVAQAWLALLRSESPYLALLAPVAGLAETLRAAVKAPEAGLHLRLAFPWPDLEASLCHPAFTPFRLGGNGSGAQGVGLYGPGAGGRLLASAAAPGGPPFPAALAFSTLAARAAARALQRGLVHAVLGEASGAEAGPLLFATYLVYSQGSLPEGARAALEAVDREALVRTFVPGPAVALRTLLPPPLQPAPPPAPPGPSRPSAPAAARPFTLGYPAGVPEQKAVAERLQVLLHDAGYPVRLVADSPARLRAARRAGTLQAALVSVLLPPVAGPALALVLGLLEDEALLHRELPGLGAEPDAEARAARTSARAAALLPQLPVFPLYVRGLRAGLSVALLQARRDGFGLLVLDEAWLGR
ncbi:MAG: peptide ABC transporter substrate-binding protein [Myxococcaceae bacterium]